METVHCGYPGAGTGLGIIPLMTPPTTPTDLQESCPSLECDDGVLYSQHQYSKPQYSSSPLLPTPEERLSPPETPVTTPVSSPSPVQSPTAQGRGRRTGTTTAPPHKLSNRSRKSSFVYDVRLTDEQFLFFVPDLVSVNKCQ